MVKKKTLTALAISVAIVGCTTAGILIYNDINSKNTVDVSIEEPAPEPEVLVREPEPEPEVIEEPAPVIEPEIVVEEEEEPVIEEEPVVVEEPKKDKEKIAGFFKVTGDNLNIRSGPNKKYESLGEYDTGDIGKYYGIENNWLRIKYKGQDAYIYSGYTVTAKKKANL